MGQSLRFDCWCRGVVLCAYVVYPRWPSIRSFLVKFSEAEGLGWLTSLNLCSGGGMVVRRRNQVLLRVATTTHRHLGLFILSR